MPRDASTCGGSAGKCPVVAGAKCQNRLPSDRSVYIYPQRDSAIFSISWYSGTFSIFWCFQSFWCRKSLVVVLKTHQEENTILYSQTIIILVQKSIVSCIRSNSFSVINGVRQGSLLSPFLFSIYTDELSILLTYTGFCSSMHGVTNNHIMYAED